MVGLSVAVAITVIALQATLLVLYMPLFYKYSNGDLCGHNHDHSISSSYKTNSKRLADCLINAKTYYDGELCWSSLKDSIANSTLEILGGLNTSEFAHYETNEVSADFLGWSESRREGSGLDSKDINDAYILLSFTSDFEVLGRRLEGVGWIIIYMASLDSLDRILFCFFIIPHPQTGLLPSSLPAPYL